MNGKMSKIAFTFLSIALAASGQDKKLNTASIDELTGLKGKLNEQENVYKVSAPKTDLKISVDNLPLLGRGPAKALAEGIKAALALTNTKH